LINFSVILIPILFSLGIGIMFKSIISGRGNNHRKELKNLLKEEALANRSKNIEIPENLFINPKEDFSFKDSLQNELLQKLKISVSNKANSLMIFPQKEPNIQLKKKYGPSTIKKIALYEGNYYQYVHSLNMFAEALIREGLYQEAREVIDYTIIHMKSDLNKSIELRDGIYKKIREGEN